MLAFQQVPLEWLTLRAVGPQFPETDSISCTGAKQGNRDLFNGGHYFLMFYIVLTIFYIPVIWSALLTCPRVRELLEKVTNWSGSTAFKYKISAHHLHPDHLLHGGLTLRITIPSTLVAPRLGPEIQGQPLHPESTEVIRTGQSWACRHFLTPEATVKTPFCVPPPPASWCFPCALGSIAALPLGSQGWQTLFSLAAVSWSVGLTMLLLFSWWVMYDSLQTRGM